jgi:hypothetical protein
MCIRIILTSYLYGLVYFLWKNFPRQLSSHPFSSIYLAFFYILLVFNVSIGSTVKDGTVAKIGDGTIGLVEFDQRQALGLIVFGSKPKVHKTIVT